MHRHVVRSLGLAVLALALAGCWPQAGFGPGNTRYNDLESTLTRANVTSLAEQWRTPIDSFITEPLVWGGRIYVANRSYDDSGSILDVLAVQAYDRDTGALVWERSLLPPDGAQVSGDVAAPAIEDGALWVPYWHDGLGCGGRLARLDLDTGDVLSSDVTSSGLSDLVMTGSSVAYVEGACETTGSRLVVRDQATRAIEWTFTFPRRDVETPVSAGGRLFVLVRGVLHAFDAGGCGAAVCDPQWTEDVGTTIFDFIRHLTAGPDDTLVMIGRPAVPGLATVVVRDAATGDVRWEAESRYTATVPGAITGLSVTEDTVYVAGARVEDPDTTEPTEAILDAYPLDGCGQPVCAPAWTAGLGPTRPAREPTVAGGVVYVPLVSTSSVAPALVAVDAGGCGAATCGELTRVPLVDGGPVYISGTQSYRTSVAEGGVFVGLLPGLYGETETELIAFGPSSGGS
jgi:outer membrane protein assembly factor BamB